MGSGRVLEKVKSGRVPENVGFERVSKMGDPGEYRKCGIWVSTGNVGFGRVPEKVKSGRVPEKVGSERVSEMGDPDEYRKCGI